ncbi:papain family cysteine protease domain-containing protein [Ditylenchus destructor]|uniref:Papain family cysteine protease domain-containing protein n=1 Tax=Ditylenchus destructor TaxID=166010 RepID=A0AAD4MQX6_9BILA|nr:papain family cysteine protease domain-containing protein [Ditylenchus destructor]
MESFITSLLLGSNRCAIHVYRIYSLLFFICHGFAASVERNSSPGIPLEEEALTGQELVDYINANQNLWKARFNSRFTSFGNDFKGDLLGIQTRKYSGSNLTVQENITLPTSFDAREKWPYCQSIWRIDDQSSCACCWAIAAANAMSDRICIASEGKIQISLSVIDLATCCANCSANKEKGGCFGGSAVLAWQFWNSDGLVTGSDYTRQMGCRQPPFVITNDSEAIQRELYTNGPLEVTFFVYEDFEHYTSGIKHVGGKFRYAHCSRLIGWGEENRTPFWILANTYNSDWGDHGFFRIIRGSNECYIETQAVGALPDLKRYQAAAAD